MPKDNWENRSEKMCCATCMSYVTKKPCTTFGRCRKHAPTMAGFPPVFATDWCGDHKLDEAKIQGVEISVVATYLWDGLPVPEGSTIRLFYICPECGKLVQFTNGTKRGDAVHCPRCLCRKVLE